ncbi:hypothetical protein N7519_002945 [Penicillium mononematosum]|uniref:uncharacterized protein n=1 Tax=Penicillium mononematosum TaxID=268346 RepID=UPI002548E078|nr:uncharacterized protein N7519_002945 [Penicillium mononematosum]KAJ6188037.1 hypothetical protein N7519_002945 [Penicillium mononematosum]
MSAEDYKDIPPGRFCLRTRPLPTRALSDGSNRRFSPSKHFWPVQLNHYGVQFEEKDFSGNGPGFMEKVLQEGKCDHVPGHILEL